MNKNSGLLILSLAFILSACVTINIYFPAAAADKIADKIIDDVWQIKNGQENKEQAPKDGEAKDGEKPKDTTQPAQPAPVQETK